MKQKILVVDDEEDVLDILTMNLRGAGFSVVSASTGSAAMTRAREEEPALIILDLMLPEMSGFEVCKALKKDPVTSRIPVIILSAKTDTVDRIVGLELGVDDYVTKPFSPRELLLRVNAVLRRGKEPEREEKLECGPVTLDRARFQVKIYGKEADLTATEFRLLALLLERRGRVQERDQLLRDVWGYEVAIDTRTVDTHIRRLREKMGKAADCVETVRGMGYRFVEG